MAKPFNKFQNAAKRVYFNGEAAHVTTLAEVENVGDTLFLFIMRELADEGEDQMNGDVAIDRMIAASRDIAVVLEALEMEGD